MKKSMCISEFREIMLESDYGYYGEYTCPADVTGKVEDNFPEEICNMAVCKYCWETAYSKAKKGAAI